MGTLLPWLAGTKAARVVLSQSGADEAAVREIRRLRRIADAPRSRQQRRAEGRRFPNPLEVPPGDRNFEHVLICGPTGLGKGELIKWYLEEIAKIPETKYFWEKPAVFCVDGDGKLTLELAELHRDWIAKGEAVYDPLHQTRHGIGVGFPQPSTAEDRDVAEAQNRDSTSFLKSFIASFQEEMDLMKMVQTDETADDLGSLIFDRLGTADIFDLLTAFQFKTKQQQALKDACWNGLTKQKWNENEFLPPTDRRAQLVPVRRRIEKIIRCVQLRNRSIATLDLAAFLNAGGWYLAGAGSEADLGREDATKLCRLLLWVLFSLAWNKRLTRRVIVIVDEGLGLKLIDATLARALAELRKYGIQFVIVVQDPYTLDEATRMALMDNCRFKVIFAYQDPDISDYFARMIALRRLEIRTKYTTTTTRRIVDGYKEVPTHGTAVSKDPSGQKKTTDTTNTHFEPIYRDVQESQNIPFSFNELIQLEQGEMMGMGIGQCKIVSTDYVSSGIENFHKVEMPWDGLFHPGPPRILLAELKLRKLMQTLYATNPVYQLQRVNYPTWEPITKTNGQATPNYQGNGKAKVDKNPKRNGKNPTTPKQGNGTRKRFTL